MKKILAGLFVITFMTTLQANAFDLVSALKFWESATEPQTAQVQATKTLDDIQNQMTTIDTSMQNAFLDIVSELSNRKETKAVKSQVKSATDITSVISAYTNTLASNKDSMVATINKMSEKEKTNLVNNIASLSQFAQQYLLLATDGVKTASNSLKATQKLSEFATTVNNINSIAGQLKNRATTVYNLVNQARVIAQAAGLTVQ